MGKNIEYEFYKGEYNTAVERAQKSVTMYERGGWSRSYTLTFKELVKYAKQWDIALDLKADDKTVAEIGTNIILANNAVEHGLNPYDYVPRSEKVTDPREINTIKNFEKLLKKHNIEQVLAVMSEDSKDNLKEILNKK